MPAWLDQAGYHGHANQGVGGRPVRAVFHIYRDLLIKFPRICICEVYTIMHLSDTQNCGSNVCISLVLMRCTGSNKPPVTSSKLKTAVPFNLNGFKGQNDVIF